VQRRGLFGPLGRLVGGLFGRRLSGLLGDARRLDRMLRQLYRRRARIVACTLWQLAGWIAGAGEIWLALRFLGHPVAVGDALIVEALAQAVSSAAFVVPAALGVQEGGFLVIGGLVGLGPELSLALALARRARDILIFVPALLAWQASEGHRLLARA
jgi:glycosyltransferase 2 family protein